MVKKPPFSRAVHIGTSGFSYPHWKGNFYPTDLPAKQWLNYYSSTFSTLELNTTFYHLPLDSSIKNWYSQVPSDFLFSVKASRYITHLKKLHECKESLETFYSRLESLKSKRGPILFQLPPSFQCDKDRLAEFIKNLNPRHSHVFEFRHPSWFNDDIYQLLSNNNSALCISDLNGHLSPEELTTDFTYIRLHGPKKAYAGSYGHQLFDWRKKIEKWSAEATVFCYFDNDEKGYAIEDAKKLQGMFSTSPPD